MALLNNIIEFGYGGTNGSGAGAALPPAGQVQLRRRDHAVPARAGAMTAFERIVRAAARRPARVLVIVAVLAAIGCALALRLEPSAATDTLVGRGADTYKATERYREKFGDHSVIVLVRGELSNLLLTSNLGRLIGLEGCLSGNKPAGQQAPGGASSPCGKLATLKPVKVSSSSRPIRSNRAASSPPSSAYASGQRASSSRRARSSSTAWATATRNGSDTTVRLFQTPQPRRLAMMCG